MTGPIDWDAQVLAPLHATFGETVAYYPGAGSAFITLTGIFDEAYTGVLVANGITVQSAMPVLGVRRAQFQADPAQGDEFVIIRTGARYVVKKPVPDSHGEIKLLANKVS